MPVSSVNSSPVPAIQPSTKSMARENKEAELNKQKVRSKETLNTRVNQLQSEIGTRINIAV